MATSFGDPLRPVDVDVGDHHHRTLAGERDRGLPPDPVGAAGDQGDLPVDAAHQDSRNFVTTAMNSSSCSTIG